MDDGVFARYWSAYGGFRALLTSRYLYLAILLSFVMTPAWVSGPWHQTVISIVPNLLGFSLGGYAMFLAVGDDKFRALMAGSKDQAKASPFMEFNATFVHFILMQLLALIAALIASAYYFTPDPNGLLMTYVKDNCIPLNALIAIGNFIGYTIFTYALLTSIAASLAILRISSLYDKSKSLEIQRTSEANKRH